MRVDDGRLWAGPGRPQRRFVARPDQPSLPLTSRRRPPAHPSPLPGPSRNNSRPEAIARQTCPAHTARALSLNPSGRPVEPVGASLPSSRPFHHLRLGLGLAANTSPSPRRAPVMSAQAVAESAVSGLPAPAGGPLLVADLYVQPDRPLACSCRTHPAALLTLCPSLPFPSVPRSATRELALDTSLSSVQSQMSEMYSKVYGASLLPGRCDSSRPLAPLRPVPARAFVA